MKYSLQSAIRAHLICFLGIIFGFCSSSAPAEVLLSPEGRIVVRENTGRVTVYTDTDSDGTFDVVETLAPSGINQVILPSAGRIFLRGDGVNVYVDSDKDGHYEINHTLIPTNVASVQLTGQGRVVIMEKNGRVTVFTDTDGNGTYDSVHNLAVNSVKDINILGDGRILLRYSDGKLVVYRDKDNDSIYEIQDTIAPANVDWFTVAGPIFFRVKGVVTAAADLDDDGIYEHKFRFPESNVISVTNADNRTFIRDSNGGLTVYFDKNKDCTYAVHQQLMISGMTNFSIPAGGKVIIEGNDGSVAVYWDKNGDGIYETTSVFNAPAERK